MKKKGVVFVIFGATGDLTKRKLIPGIYNLINHHKIDKFHILGIARKPFSNEKLINSSKKFIKNPNTKIISTIKKNSSYLQLDFKESNFIQLKSKLDELKKKGYPNRIFYLATGSNNFHPISKKLKDSRIMKDKTGWTRVIFEKPFGLNLKSSNKLDRCLKEIFNENQIYRIDHYLGKELVGNISIIRFTNQIFEPIWNKDHIKNIQIILDEDFGIEERGPYYDHYGAIRDMVQNHMLQLLALITMKMPKSFSEDNLRDKKSELLDHVKIKNTIIGQYKGYTSEKGIKKNSKTETFSAHVLEINNSQWKGVPVYFRTGKFLNRKESKIIINFKKVKCLFEKSCQSKENFLEIQIFPDEGISFELNVKRPGKFSAVPAKMIFSESCTFGPNTPEGYENLFLDIINGDQSTFTRQDELRKSWKIVDKVKRGKIYRYKKGSKGPKELESFNKKHKIIWH